MLQNVERWILAILRATALGCIVVLATLAWLPAGTMARTALSGQSEHFVAYMGTALLIGLAFRKYPPLSVQCGLLVLYAAFLEAGQLCSPGRHAAFHDLVFSAAGVATGGLLLWVAPKRLSSWLRLGAIR